MFITTDVNNRRIITNTFNHITPRMYLLGKPFNKSKFSKVM